MTAIIFLTTDESMAGGVDSNIVCRIFETVIKCESVLLVGMQNRGSREVRRLPSPNVLPFGTGCPQSLVLPVNHFHSLLPSLF
jgi:hypothetical protein